MTIGITIGLTKEYESLWVNGIKLNALIRTKKKKIVNVILTRYETS